jgi:hypothetical protein
MVVGCIPEWENKILLCRRAIEPRHGKWTLPAGYLENGETVAEGAARETYEEARAKVEKLTPYALYSICYVNQVYLMFRAAVKVWKSNSLQKTKSPGKILPFGYCRKHSYSIIKTVQPDNFLFIQGRSFRTI